VKYTHSELELIAESKHTKRMLSAMWVTGTGPRGGKVSVGKGRYDALNMMVIEGKAEVILRFRTDSIGPSSPLLAYGLMVRIKPIKKDKRSKPVQTSATPVAPTVDSGAKPPWEE
jgi:hypothetical protein